MVRFEVLEPPTADLPDLAARLQDVLGVRSVRIAPGNQVQRDYRGIGDLLGEELRSMDPAGRVASYIIGKDNLRRQRHARAA